jgi:hypothetical protein
VSGEVDRVFTLDEGRERILERAMAEAMWRAESYVVPPARAEALP